jgi:hypothetical protein
MSSCAARSASVPRLIWLRICRSEGPVMLSSDGRGHPRRAADQELVGDPLRNGASFVHMGVLVAVAVVVTALAPWFFSRRDVAT